MRRRLNASVMLLVAGSAFAAPAKDDGGGLAPAFAAAAQAAAAQPPNAPVTVAIPTGAQPAAPAPAPGTSPGPGENRSASDASGMHTLNLKDADIRVLIATVSEITGRNFIVDPRVEGKVNVVSNRPMKPEEIYQVFESVLRVHGYATVAAGSMVKILPEAIASQDGSAGTQATGPDTLVTRVISLRHVPAQELQPILRAMVPQSGQLAIHAPSNSLIISDRAGNIARLEALIARIDQGSDAAIEVIPLSHANAAEMSRTLTLLADDKTAAINGGGSSRVFADARTNSILLSGDKAARLKMRALVAHLDTPISTGEGTEVVYVNNAKAADLVPILESVAGTLTEQNPANKEQAKAATIQAHAETNAIVITAAPAVYKALSGIVRQLDIRRVQVQVEGIVAEVSDQLASELGLQFQSTTVKPILDEDGKVTGVTDGVLGGTNFPGTGGAGSIFGAASNPFSVGNGLNVGYITGSITLPGSNTPILQVGALARALRGDARNNILSTPFIVTMDNQQAVIKVGQEVPFLTGSYSNTSGTGGSNQPTNPFQTIERKDVGITLTVTPHVNEGDSVRLDIKQEVSSLAPSPVGAVDLVTNKREINTSVMVPDGALLVLGGLSSVETSESVSKVPGLGDIPVLGNLFRYRSATKTKRNLVVFLKPTILRDAAAAATVTGERYNFLRAEQIGLRSREDMLKADDHAVLPDAMPDRAEPGAADKQR